MAGGYGGQLVALDVEQPNLDLVSPLARVAALKQQQVQTEEAKQQLEQEPLRAEALRLANAAARQKNVAGQQANTLGQMQLRDALIGDAAARALDSDSWDQLMSEAVKNGAPEAAQFIGRYNPVLQSTIRNAYGAAPGGGAAGGGAPGAAGGGAGAPSGDQKLALMFEGQNPQQLQQSFQRTSAILQALSSVKDQQSYEQAVQWLTQNGVPEAQKFAGFYNAPMVSALYNQYLPIYQYLQGRLAGASVGAAALPPAREVKEGPGKILYSVDPLGRNATQLTPWTGLVPSEQNLVQTNLPGASGGAPAASAPTALDTFVDNKLVPSESGGVPTAQNPRSSAGGLGQFTDATWRSTLMKHRPDLVEGKTDAQVLAMKNNPVLNRQMTHELARDNVAVLRGADLPVTTLTVGLAHVLGANDVKAFLGATENTPMDKIVGNAAMDANPQFWNHNAQGARTTPKTAGEIWKMYQAKWGNTSLEDVSPQGGPEGSPDNSSGVTVLAKGQTLTPDAIDYLAQQYVITGQIPAMGMGGTAQREAIFNRAAEIEKETGATGQDAVTRHLAIKAATSTLTQVQRQQAQVQQFEETARLNGQQVLQTMDKGVGPTKLPVFDRWVQSGRRATGDPEVSRFDTAVKTFAKEYARVMTGGTGNVQLSDAASKEAEDLINGAMNEKQLRAVVDQMNKDMDNRSAALDKQLTAARATIQNGGIPPASAQAGNNPMAPVDAHTVAQLKAAQPFRGSSARPGSEQNPLMPTSKAQYDKLPKGTYYIYTDGSIRRKA